MKNTNEQPASRPQSTSFRLQKAVLYLGALVALFYFLKAVYYAVEVFRQIVAA
jgi:hypothetical protein